jgi:hypothetical protein
MEIEFQMLVAAGSSKQQPQKLQGKLLEVAGVCVGDDDFSLGDPFMV